MKKGEGKKEVDGSIRDTPLYCILPKSKIDKISLIAKAKNYSKTDAVSEALDLFISENQVYIDNFTDI